MSAHATERILSCGATTLNSAQSHFINFTNFINFMNFINYFCIFIAEMQNRIDYLDAHKHAKQKTTFYQPKRQPVKKWQTAI